MGTRSTISMANADGTVTSIYCHWDGYLGHNGRILRDHYDTAAKVKALMKLHSLSSLGEFVGKKHDFEQRFPHGAFKPCTSHVRDRGEKIKAYVGWLEGVDRQEYNYLFKDGAWTVSEEDDDVWKDLRAEIITNRLTQ